MKAAWFLACVECVCFALVQGVYAGGERFDSLETEGFVVHTQVRHDFVVSPAARETANILEQFLVKLDGELPQLFGLTLNRRKAVIYIYSDRDTFYRNLAGRGTSLLSMPTDRAGGFFDIRTGEILLFQQPTAYYTRQILLHEFVHWYIWQLLGDKSLMLPHWLQEGLADHYAVHRWDGKTLKPATPPVVMLEDYPARAIGAVKVIRSGHDLEHSLDLYALYWAMTRYLVLQQPENLIHMIRHGFPDNPVDWETLEVWLEKEQIPWLWVWNCWEQIAGTGVDEELFGISATTGMIVHKTPCDRLEFSVRPETKSWTLGIVFDFTDTDRFEIIQLKNHEKDASLSWRHISRTGSGWKIQTEWGSTKISSRTPAEVNTEITDNMISVSWNNEPVTSLPVKTPSLLGLSVHESAITFQVGRVTP